ncbi:MAG: hypothetical protein IT167_07380 [Bryobacterales bacterium]|nr:hypothetical protein [Bryobacterales bacterium]
MLGSLFNKSRTRAQINRENARKSTGPKTPAGKAAVSRNSLKEGFSASFAIVAPEDEEFYHQFLAGHRAELNPQGAQQEDLFRRISLAAWNIRRIEKLTLALFDESDIDPLAGDDPAITAKLERYTRHQTLNERSYYRGVKLLSQLQKEASTPAECPPPEHETAQSHIPQDPPQPPGGAPESDPNQPSEAADSLNDKTKPEPAPEITPEIEPANQANPDPDPEDLHPGPNHLLLIVK